MPASKRKKRDFQPGGFDSTGFQMPVQQTPSVGVYGPVTIKGLLVGAGDIHVEAPSVNGSGRLVPVPALIALHAAGQISWEEFAALFAAA